MTIDELNKRLDGVNDLLIGIQPLIGSSMLLVRMLIPLLKKHGVEVGPFEAEIAKFDAQNDAFQQAINQFPRSVPPEAGNDD